MPLFTLKPAPPFRLDLTVWVLRRVEVNQTDRWDGRTWRRVLVMDDTPVSVEVTQSGPPRDPQLTVAASGIRLTPSRRRRLEEQLATMLGLDVDLGPFYRLARDHKQLFELIKPFRGFKPPRLGSAFETLLNAVACQQISMAAGMHLLNRLSEARGLAVGDQHAFVRPIDLVSADVGALRAMGFSRSKAQTMLTIARSIVDGPLDLEALRHVDDQTAINSLLQLKGVGRWTAHYVLLRGLGRLNVFPVDDIGGQNKIQEWLKLSKRPDGDRVAKILSPWRPYQGLLYFNLLLDHQRQAGLHKIAV